MAKELGISRNKYERNNDVILRPEKIRSGRNITRIVGKSRYNRKGDPFLFSSFFFMFRKKTTEKVYFLLVAVHLREVE